MNARVLVVEDDLELGTALLDTLELSGWVPRLVGSGEAAMEQLGQSGFDLVLSDVNMAGMDGFALLVRIKREHPGLPVVLMTAYGTVEKAVAAMRAGADDYLVKPFASEALLETLSQCCPLPAVADAPIAESLAARQLLQVARKVAESESTALICGESGTGKEVLARYLHDASPRRDGPFVAINCAAIPENMLEAMLFGHEKGAFTGAHQAQAGKFEQANGGTLLLDEVTEMELGLQAKLLRVLQEREVERLGGRAPIALDVRVVATTNRDLEAAVRSGGFREDLYYRLSVFPLAWAPLRERREDILPLARHFLHLRAGDKRPPVLGASAERALIAHSWPGNVRELDNRLQRAAILQEGGCIEADHLGLQPSPAPSAIAGSQALRAAHGDRPASLEEEVRQHEFERIRSVLERHAGNRQQTAASLGISPRTLRYKLAQMRDAGFALG
ncbi:MAG: sigma-54 dependent transcriptional regulator [Pseudomonadota bacterium]|nr:sigma-54 dependent transcriptional regulator [Pseudomonadota bacterium]